MQDDYTAADPELSCALDAWSPLPPPTGFADRVLAARDAGAVALRPRRWRIAAAVCVVAAGAAVAGAAVVLRSSPHAAAGTLRAERRTTAAIGDRGVAVAEPASELTWRSTTAARPMSCSAAATCSTASSPAVRSSCTPPPATSASPAPAFASRSRT